MFRARKLSEIKPLASLSLSRFQKRRLSDSWSVMFCEHILPLLREDEFSHFYHTSHGAPNREVQIVLGILLLKDMFDYTDEEALGHFAFDLRWHVALNLVGEPISCCQKTLHNFRRKLREHEASAKVFEGLVGDLKQLLDIDTSRQRLDSTHSRSDTAILSRLGLFCETIRLFLRRLRKDLSSCFTMVPQALSARYLDDLAKPANYDYADRLLGRRRLEVVARDLGRLLDIFGDLDSLQDWQELACCRRLFKEQCQQTQVPVRPQVTQDDLAQGPVKAALLPSEEIASSSMQSPHDPDVSYGHKGQGYEVHISETVGNKTEETPDKPELITYVNLGRSCESDVRETMPALQNLKERDLLPSDLLCDSNYTSAEVILQAGQMGTRIVGPVKGRGELPGEHEVTLGDFHLDYENPQKSKCPQGHALHGQQIDPKPAAATPGDGEKSSPEKPRRITLVMLAVVCASCPVAAACPLGKKKDTLANPLSQQEVQLPDQPEAAKAGRQEQPKANRVETAPPMSGTTERASEAGKDSQDEGAEQSEGGQQESKPTKAGKCEEAEVGQAERKATETEQVKPAEEMEGGKQQEEANKQDKQEGGQAGTQEGQAGEGSGAGPKKQGASLGQGQGKAMAQAAKRVLRAGLDEVVSSQRRREQTTKEHRNEYGYRAGIEATNSEVKRKHGLRKLRVRGEDRVKQAVYLKMAACNIKRAVNYFSRLAKRRA